MSSALGVLQGKKRKREAVQDEADSFPSILLLENQILESRRYYNNIVTLLKQCWSQDTENKDKESTIAVVALYRIFCRLIASGKLSKSREAPENEATIVQWLNARYLEYKDTLLSTLSQDDPSRKSSALTLLMRLIKVEATNLRLSEEGFWRTGTFVKVLKALIDATDPSGDILDEFVQEFVQRYDDIRFYTFARLW